MITAMTKRMTPTQRRKFREGTSPPVKSNITATTATTTSSGFMIGPFDSAGSTAISVILFRGRTVRYGEKPRPDTFALPAAVAVPR